jgi:uncharacterized protein YybS (DUF2232 family)
LQFLIPHGLLGVLLGYCWKRRVKWGVSIPLGTVLGACGLLFQIGLLSVLLGDNLWLYVNQQVTGLLNWFFDFIVWILGFFGISLVLAEANLATVQLVAVALVIINAAVYNLVVHLAAWLLFERVGSPIPPPPEWLQTLLDYRD